MTLRPSALAALCAALALAPLPAPAAPPAPAPASPPAATPEGPATPSSKVAVLAPALVGTEDALVRDQVAAELRSGLSRGRFLLLGAAEVDRVAGERCEDACVKRLQKELGADFVLRSTISVSDRDFTLRLELVATGRNETAAESERLCELCGLAELRALAADQSARLQSKLEALAKPPPVFEISSTPKGALVFVDNQLVGQTPVERTLLEGDHVVRVALDGYVPEEREVSAVAGLREQLQIELRRTPETLKLRGAGWGLLFSGIASFIVGVGLLSVDGNQFRGDCEGSDIDVNGNCRFVLDTDVGGATMTALGAGLGTAGALLLHRTRDRNRARRLRARLGPTGLSLSGSF